MFQIPDNLPPWKQDKYRMVSSWQTLNQTCQKGQIVFAGSSLMEMFPVEQFAREEVFDPFPAIEQTGSCTVHPRDDQVFPILYNRGVGGWRTEDMLLCLNEMVLDLMPRRLFINIGTNDLSDATVTIDALIRRYDQIITRIEAAIPQVEIIFMAYYPINYDAATQDMKPCLRIRTNERIREANQAVRALAERHHQRYMDFNAPLTDDLGRLKAEFTIEGMHIREDGYRAIWPLVREAILL